MASQVVRFVEVSPPEQITCSFPTQMMDPEAEVSLSQLFVSPPLSLLPLFKEYIVPEEFPPLRTEN